jgi:phosphoenolpyruvate synthase/pyruvate phosphate dikinase
MQTIFQYDIGAIIETPRACLCADRIVKTPGVTSVLFSCDQLTEFVLGISKCESAKLTHSYRQEGISKGTVPQSCLDLLFDRT